MAGGEPAARVLFVCVENSCRSQMAEGFARRLGGARVRASSGGSRPSGQVNPRAVAFMAEAGCNLAGHRSEGVDGLRGEAFDAVVTMGCGDACPNVRTERREDWAVRDPKNLSDEEFRAVRDDIRQRVARLLADLGAE